MYREAIQNLQLYLLASPTAANVAVVKAKIYELEVKQEDADKLARLAGAWQIVSAKDNGQDDRSVVGRPYNLEISEGKIILSCYNDNTSRIITLTRKGQELSGIYEKGSWTTPSDLGNCTLPGYKQPVTGTISEDFKAITLHYEWANYAWSYQGAQCLGVSIADMRKSEMTLMKAPPPPPPPAPNNNPKPQGKKRR
jgi:hypothetical protein